MGFEIVKDVYNFLLLNNFDTIIYLICSIILLDALMKEARQEKKKKKNDGNNNVARQPTIDD